MVMKIFEQVRRRTVFIGRRAQAFVGGCGTWWGRVEHVSGISNGILRKSSMGPDGFRALVAGSGP
jgi:hypothetical protein